MTVIDRLTGKPVTPLSGVVYVTVGGPVYEAIAPVSALSTLQPDNNSIKKNDTTAIRRVLFIRTASLTTEI